MRISFWHFLVLAALLVAGYYGYTTWWSKQSRADWISGVHTRALNSQEEIDEGKTSQALNTGASEDEGAAGKTDTAPARDANGWIIN